LPRPHRLQERLSQLPRTQDRRPVGNLPAQRPGRVRHRQAQAPDDAGTGGELLPAGYRRHRRLPVQPEVSRAMTKTSMTLLTLACALALSACGGKSEGGHAPANEAKASSAGLPDGNI